MVTWRQFSDWAKARPAALQLAESLGRGRRRLCILDHVGPLVAAPHRPRLVGWEKHDLAAAWVGHSTVLLRIGGMNILTDPVFSARIGLDLGVITGGPRRLIAPAVRMDQLPKVDLVLVSHAHFDHLDRPSLARLPRTVPIITSQHNADLIKDLGFHSVTELPWGDSKRVGDVNITAWPVRHWGARTFHDTHRGFCAFLIEAGHHRVLFGGDTAYGDHFRSLGRVDLAILGIAAYDPYIAAHCTPEQAWTMADHMRADHVLPMHHSTFRLSHEPMDEPINRFQEAASSRMDRVALTRVGQTWSI